MFFDFLVIVVFFILLVLGCGVGVEECVLDSVEFFLEFVIDIVGSRFGGFLLVYEVVELVRGFVLGG